MFGQQDLLFFAFMEIENGIEGASLEKFVRVL